MFNKILIANRGEIAIRIIRACRDLDIGSVAVFSDADRGAAFVHLADEAIHIGAAPTLESYLNGERIIAAALSCGAEAIHPGYGFLSENSDFAQECQDAGITFIGPSPQAISAMGDKVSARKIMEQAGVPVVPGSDVINSDEEAFRVADSIGYPVMVKASGGGGGIGMQVAKDAEDLKSKITSVRNAAQRFFGNATIFLERYVDEPRHIEIQIVGDEHGHIVHLGERECTIQRRHQKIVEESPSPVMTTEMRDNMGKAAIASARAIGYTNAGTVEFIYSKGEFFFLEMNTRLQVEHPVTEWVTGIDIVTEQIRISAGKVLTFGQDDIEWRGHAIECRINAEAYDMDFRPSPGRITGYHEPGGIGVRVDSGVIRPIEISPFYDPMIAKLIVWGIDRPQALQRMSRALQEYIVTGIRTNIPFHLAIMEDSDFQAGQYTTHFIPDHPELIERAQGWEKKQEAMKGAVARPEHIAAIAAALAESLPAG